jgi:hypothetical protein
MKEFEVTISRIAYQNATLKVMAESQEAAEASIDVKLGFSDARVGLDNLSKMKGVRVVEVDCYPDEESPWELV